MGLGDIIINGVPLPIYIRNSDKLEIYSEFNKIVNDINKYRGRKSAKCIYHHNGRSSKTIKYSKEDIDFESYLYKSYKISNSYNSYHYILEILEKHKKWITPSFIYRNSDIYSKSTIKTCICIMYKNLGGYRSSPLLRKDIGFGYEYKITGNFYKFPIDIWVQILKIIMRDKKNSNIV